MYQPLPVLRVAYARCAVEDAERLGRIDLAWQAKDAGHKLSGIEHNRSAEALGELDERVGEEPDRPVRCLMNVDVPWRECRSGRGERPHHHGSHPDEWLERLEQRVTKRTRAQRLLQSNEQEPEVLAAVREVERFGQAARDAVTRMFYVAVTRARERLILGGSSSGHAINWRGNVV